MMKLINCAWIDILKWKILQSVANYTYNSSFYLLNLILSYLTFKYIFYIILLRSRDKEAEIITLKWCSSEFEDYLKSCELYNNHIKCLDIFQNHSPTNEKLPTTIINLVRSRKRFNYAYRKVSQDDIDIYKQIKQNN